MKSKMLSLFQVALIATLPPSLGTALSQNYQVESLGWAPSEAPTVPC